MKAPACIAIIAALMLAGTLACRGDIIVTWLDEPIEVGGWWNPSTPQSVDIDGNGVNDFSFSGDQFSISAGFRSEGINRYLITPSPPPNIGGAVSALQGGHLIGSQTGTDSLIWFGDDHDYWSTLMTQYDTGRVGEFWGIRAYIGIEFQIGGDIHYGWIDVEGDASLPYLTVYGWAYENTPGVGILAGAIPEPSTLLLLLAGGIGLLSYKRCSRNIR